MLDPTGGLIYHWRAFRHRKLWAPYVRELGDWLKGWKPNSRKLLLVGPSAGYSLDAEFLSRFDEIAAIEPDPVARTIFTIRFRKRVKWNTSPKYLAPVKGRFQIAGFKKLLAEYPDHAILFCNLLGQLRFIDEKAAFSKSFKTWKAEIFKALQGREWASFHDRLSGPLQPKPWKGLQPPKTDQELLDIFYPLMDETVELLDHFTEDLFPALPRTFFAWEITPDYWYLVEGVRVPLN